MLHTLHNLHFVLYLLVKNSILDEPPFLQFFGSIRQAVILGRDLVYDGKGSFTDRSSSVVLSRACPFASILPTMLWGPGLLFLGDLVRLLSLESSLDRGLEQVQLTTRPGGDSLALSPQTMALEKLLYLVGVGQIVFVVSARDADKEGQVSGFLVEIDSDDRA